MPDSPDPRPDPAFAALLGCLDAEARLPPRPTQYRRGWAEANAAAAHLVRLALRAALADSPDPRLTERERIRNVIDNFTGRRRIQISDDDIDDLTDTLWTDALVGTQPQGTSPDPREREEPRP